MAAGKALRVTALAALAAGVFLSLAAADLALRSRSALKEAEKYEAGAASPGGTSASGNGGSPAPADRAADLAEARAAFLNGQSRRKMAYIWYKTAAEDFNFPGNPWAAKARARLPGALAAWRAELAAAGVKAEPWMTQ